MAWLVRTILIAAMIACGSEAYAVRGVVAQQPLNKMRSHVYSKASGLRTTLDSRWFPDGGYLPVRVQIEAKAAAIVDRQIELTLHLVNNAQSRRFRTSRDPSDAVVTVSRELTLPANELELKAKLLCPSVGPSDTLIARVAVDGVEDPALESTTGLVPTSSRYGGGLRVLRPYQEGFPVGGVSEEWQALGSRRNSWVALNQLTTESYDDWIAYSSADVIAMNLIRLEQLAEDDPARLDPLRRWLLAGGTLWIEQAEPYGAKTMEDTSLAKIDRLLGLQRWRFAAVGEESQRLPDEDADEQEPADAKAPPDTEEEGSVAESADDSAGAEESSESELRQTPFIPIDGAPGWGYDGALRRNRPDPPGPSLGNREFRLGQLVQQFKSLSARDSRAWYARREAGFGRVLAFRQAAKAMPAELNSIAGVSIIGTWRQREWNQRHGLEVGGRANEFGNLLIPDIGVAPVNEFQVLITLFVLLIGPLNYWLLWRQRQLHLLVVTAPLGALIVTLGLVAYAAVSDGFGVKARVRSATLLDQTTGEAASWSRVTHYAATAPTQPAVIPDDTTIYPINPAWEGAFNTTGGGKTLEWTSEGQRLLRGWFPTRTAVQHLLIRSRSTQARLDIQDQGETPTVVNRLGAPIRLLLLRHESGDWFVAEETPPEGEVTLEPIEYLQAAFKYRTLAIEHRPEYPLGAGKAIKQTLDRLGKTGDVRRMQRSLSNATLENNLENAVLGRVEGLTSAPTLDVPPGTYVAVTDTVVETPLGWDRVEEVGSFHVILGRW